MEDKNKNYIVKTIVFLLIVGLTCLLFFGLGNEEKTTNELIAFGILVFSEVLVFGSIVVCNLLNKSPDDALAASALYALATIILNFIVNLTITKDLIIWNIVVFIVYLIILLLVATRKKK